MFKRKGLCMLNMDVINIGLIKFWLVVSCIGGYGKLFLYVYEWVNKI